MPQKIWDSPHQGNTIRNWIKRGLLLREGETYKGIYSFVMSIDNCNLCKVKFNDEVNNEWRCMDHDHKTCYFRQVICQKCNHGFDRKLTKISKRSKTGHRWITPMINKRKNKKIDVYFHYNRIGFSQTSSTSLTKMIAYSFIQLLKKPI